MPQQANIVDRQMMEVPLAGQAAGEPNRMFICTGKLQTNFYAQGTTSNVISRETFTALIAPNPPLTAGQFLRAIATASISQIQISDADPSTWDTFQWGIEEAQADLDDESNQAELRVTVMALPRGNGTGINITEVAFQVTISARV